MDPSSTGPPRSPTSRWWCRIHGSSLSRPRRSNRATDASRSSSRTTSRKPHRARAPHTLEQAVADLEAVRRHAGVDSWVVLGHSWGSDLAVRYALDHPSRVRSVVGIAGHGLHKDRTWSAIYESLTHTEPKVDIDWVPAVHHALGESFVEWIHEADLFRRLADCRVPMTIMAAELDIRPAWPLRQLAALVQRGAFVEIPDVPHDLWSTHPQVWVDVVTKFCHDAG
ncbi:MAG: alpha/beta hydrolase [Actinocatenispora sp.]